MTILIVLLLTLMVILLTKHLPSTDINKLVPADSNEQEKSTPIDSPVGMYIIIGEGCLRSKMLRSRPSISE